MRTLGYSAALVAAALVVTGCLGTHSDEQNPSNPSAQNNNGGAADPNNGGVQQYGAQNAYGQQQPQGAPQAQPQPASQPAGPFGTLPQLPAFPGFAMPGMAAPQDHGNTQPTQPNQPAQPQAGPHPGGGFPGPFGGGSGPSTNAGSATPIDPNVASVATVPLMAYAITEAPQMGRDGTILAGNYREGQTLEQPFQLAPNKCYTVLAVGAGPQEVDISIVAVTPLPTQSPVLASDNTTGPNASLGGRGNCYKSPVPVLIQAKYVVTARKGLGIIAAQLYSK